MDDLLPSTTRRSLSARRAWIEMSPLMWPWSPLNVALRKESVDRNFDAVQIVVVVMVALRKESVDRNGDPCYYQYRRRGSLSARRAWIEIMTSILTGLLRRVALRKESVDRNMGALTPISMTSVALRKESVDRNGIKKRLDGFQGRSLSARRAWIEIFQQSNIIKLIPGSLSARRAWIEIRALPSTRMGASSRSPQGERG